jgi:hypothetical protein
MFIATIADKNPSSVRSARLIFRPYGAGVLFYLFDYKHRVPTGLFSKTLKTLKTLKTDWR